MLKTFLSLDNSLKFRGLTLVWLNGSFIKLVTIMISRKKQRFYLYSIVPSQEMEASENPSLQTAGPAPMLFCTASKKNRFYIFSSRQPDLR